MAEEINKTYTSNSLYNDSTGVIAFAEQLKQELINWANYEHVTEKLGPDNRPDTQNQLNNLFLRVYEEFLTFLNNADATDEAINTWKEIENFLKDFTDDKTLASIVAELNSKIESRLTVPLESTTGSSTTSTMTQKAITETIDASKTFTTGEKVDSIGIDSEPTAESNNLVKSGGVYDVISQLGQKIPIELLNGAGDTLVRSSKYYVKSGVHYRITVGNPNISLEGVTSTGSAVRFSVRPYDVNGNRIGTSDIVSVTFANLNPLENSYMFIPPENTYTVEVLMRAAVGAEQRCWIEDIDYSYNAIANITTLLNDGYLFRGIAAPTTNPGTVTGKVFYLAVQPGTYTNFNGNVVADGELRVFYWYGSFWVSSLTGLAGIRDVNGIKNVAKMLLCFTAGDVAAKEITQSEYVPLYNGFQKIINFSTTNTADDCTLSINGETPRPLFLNGTRVSSSNPVMSSRRYILTWVGGANYYLTEFEKDLYEKSENKVTSVSAQSTDNQYPSAKCVYDTFQIANYANKTVINNGRINSDGSLNIATSSTFRILGPIDLSVINPGQSLFYKGITITETASHAQLYYRYLASDGETIVGVGQLKTSESLTIPDNARYLQFGISVNDITSFAVKVTYVQQEDLKSADKSLRFAVFSDLHYGNGGNDTDRVQDMYDTICDEMISSHLDFVIFNGDMVDGYSGHDPDTEYAYLYEHLINKIKCPVFFTVGNHDGVTSVKTLEQYYLKNDQCSMETDMFYFIFLNSYYLGSRDSGGLKKWTYDGVDTTFAQAELTKAAALNKIPVIVIHELGSYSSDTVLDGLLEDFEQKIVIYSHTHTAYNANKTGSGWYINPGCFLDNAKSYALCEMTTSSFKSTIVDLTNNTRTSADVFLTTKYDSANIVLYKDK